MELKACVCGSCVCVLIAYIFSNCISCDCLCVNVQNPEKTNQTSSDLIVVVNLFAINRQCLLRVCGILGMISSVVVEKVFLFRCESRSSILSI